MSFGSWERGISLPLVAGAIIAAIANARWRTTRTHALSWTRPWAPRRPRSSVIIASELRAPGSSKNGLGSLGSPHRHGYTALRRVRGPAREISGVEKGFSRMLHLYEQIEAAVAGIRSSGAAKPRVGIILGTGIGPLAEKIEVEASLDYESIPHFLKPTATGHRGRLVCGKLDGASVMAMEGRFHAYEGYTLRADHACRSA